MSDTFDWNGLWRGAADVFKAHGENNPRTTLRDMDDTAAAYLRTRIEAAFVPLHRYETVYAVAAEQGLARVQATARAEAAEARVKVLEEALREALEHWDYCRSENRDPRFVPECWTVPARQALGAEHGK